MPPDRGDDRRVVVTGYGVVSPLGGDTESTWRGALAGKSGIREITQFDARHLSCRIAGEVDDSFLASPDADGGGRILRLIRQAAHEAVAHARLGDVADRRRIAVVLGNHAQCPPLEMYEGLARHHDAEGHADLAALEHEPSHDVSQYMRRCADWHSAALAKMVDARGPNFPIVSACAAGCQAIGEGMRLLRTGRADVVVAGGAESQINYGGFVGFVLLGALVKRWTSPDKASRPFDRRRNGFIMSEGAGIVVLETESHARARGARVLGRALGYGDSADAFRITDQHPDGDGAVLAMERAIRDAGISPDDVEYVNAHGTSTPINDPTETHAIKRVLGDRARKVPVSSNKSMIGHTIGAAGAIETILALRGIEEGVLLPTINYETPDPRCDLDYVPNEARRTTHRVALKNSFGFGGQNACLVLAAADRA